MGAAAVGMLVAISLFAPHLARAAGSASAGGESAGAGTAGRKLPADPSGELVVLVTDEGGAPLAGVEVDGRYPENPGPVASFCCVDRSLGNAVTGKDGTAKLLHPPFTFRPATITARRAGWPAVSVAFGIAVGGAGAVDGRGRVVIVLGPPRDVAGRIEMGDACPPGFVEVTASAPPLRFSAPVDADGKFVLRGLPPGKVSMGFSACGRTSGAADDRSWRAGEPVVLRLQPPAARPRPRPYDLPAAVRPPAPPSGGSGSVPPPAPGRGGVAAPRAPSAWATSCAPAGRELVVAGDFDIVGTEPRCRFVLAGRRTTVNRYEATAWTIVHADGAAYPLGESSRADSPKLGEKVALVTMPGEELAATVADLVTGERESLAARSLKRVALGAADAVVLATAPAKAVTYDSVALEVRWRDGQRRQLGAHADPGWTLMGDGRWLVYGLLGERGAQKELHVLELTSRRDRMLATGVESARPFLDGPGGPRLVIGSERGVWSYDPATGAREVLVEPGAGWWALDQDLLIRRDASGAVTLRTPAGVRSLPFRWPSGVSMYGLPWISAAQLVFVHEGAAVVVDVASGLPRVLAEGIAPISSPVLAGDWLAVNETAGRTLVASLSGRSAARPVGRGTARSFSPDGRWLAIEQEMQHRYDLVAVDDPERRRLTVHGWGGTWLPGEQPVFVFTGDGAYDVSRPLHAAVPDEGRTALIDPKVLDYHPLSNGEILIVVPPGAGRPAGVWRRRVPHATVPAPGAGSRRRDP